MAQDSEYLEVIKELQGEIIAVVKELLNEEVLPLLKERQRIEKVIGNKEIKEMYELEQEVR